MTSRADDGLLPLRRARGAAGLAARILEDRSGLQHLKERDRSDDWYDLPTWQEFAKANLLGIALPESAGGLGFGFLDLCMVLREVGANVAPLPAIPTLVSGALPIARYGSDAQQAILAKVASGDVLLTAALVELGAEPEKPTTTATRDGDGWRINGVKSNVAGGDRGRARARAGRRSRAAGWRCSSCRRAPRESRPRASRRSTTSRCTRCSSTVCTSATTRCSARLEQGAEILAFTLNRTTVAMCAVVSGSPSARCA